MRYCFSYLLCCMLYKVISALQVRVRDPSVRLFKFKLFFHMLFFFVSCYMF